MAFRGPGVLDRRHRRDHRRDPCRRCGDDHGHRAGAVGATSRLPRECDERVAAGGGVHGRARVRRVPDPAGSWSIHNTETLRNRAYSAWYSNGRRPRPDDPDRPDYGRAVRPGHEQAQRELARDGACRGVGRRDRPRYRDRLRERHADGTVDRAAHGACGRVARREAGPRAWPRFTPANTQPVTLPAAVPIKRFEAASTTIRNLARPSRPA